MAYFHRHRALQVALVALCTLLTLNAQTVAALVIPELSLNPNTITVSGISAGAFAAVQLHVTFSKTFQGVASLAGGPYFCAQDDVFTALGACMKGSPAVNVPGLVATTQRTALFGYADDPSNLAGDKVWMMSALNDTVVAHTVAINDLAEYYSSFLNDPASQIMKVTDLPGEHSMQTNFYGSNCYKLGEPYINNCDFDAAGSMLRHLLGPLTAPTTFKTTGQVVPFDQRAFIVGPYLAAYGLGEEAYIYIPNRCKNASHQCHLHVAMHGCLMSIPDIGLQYVQDGGYNRWADANDIVVLYPQAIKTTLNPKACFDWWGYSGTDYASNIGIQPSTIMGMVNALVDQHT